MYDGQIELESREVEQLKEFKEFITKEGTALSTWYICNKTAKQIE